MQNIHTLRGLPGVQLYYPVVMPGETLRDAAARMQRFSAKPDTIIFDLEDGSGEKSVARELLLREMPTFNERHPIKIAVRINPHNTQNYWNDLRVIQQFRSIVETVILAKAGEFSGAGEILDLAKTLDRMACPAEIQPIIESPKSLQIAESLMRASERVEHVIFGIHDFSENLGYTLHPEAWPEQLRTYSDMLTLSASIAGKGVIGGVSTMLGTAVCPPDMTHRDVAAWLDAKGDPAARAVYRHARIDAARGWAGKQVIHTSHIHLARLGLSPAPAEVAFSIGMLQAALAAGVLLGGAIKFEGEMYDPPMFRRAYTRLQRAAALGVLPPEQTEIVTNLGHEIRRAKVGL